MIDKLFHIAQKPTRKILGLMSGTSLDGLDIALCNITGTGKRTSIVVDQFQTIPFKTEIKNLLYNLIQPDAPLSFITTSNVQLSNSFAGMINDCLKDWKVDPDAIDLIASHGQTVWHSPDPENGAHATLQLVDGDIIAKHTGIITISDFRMKHLAAGGEGAPLAGYGDFLLFGNESNDVVLMNIGGISNFTFIPAQGKGKIICTDAGPGNTLMNKAMQLLGNKDYDEEGKAAAAGNVHPDLLNKFMQHPFFALNLPKTTGPESFNWDFVQQCKNASDTVKINLEDLIATLNRFTVEAILHTLEISGAGKSFDLYITGGGLYNKTLVKNLQLNLPKANFKSFPFSPDAKEAALFALLANECVAGTPAVFEESGLLPVRMGKLSFPD